MPPGLRIPYPGASISHSAVRGHSITPFRCNPLNTCAVSMSPRIPSRLSADWEGSLIHHMTKNPTIPRNLWSDGENDDMSMEPHRLRVNGMPHSGPHTPGHMCVTRPGSLHMNVHNPPSGLVGTLAYICRFRSHNWPGIQLVSMNRSGTPLVYSGDWKG